MQQRRAQVFSVSCVSHGSEYNQMYLWLSFSVVMVATVCKARDLPAGVMAAFVHQVALESPTAEQRRAMLSSLSRDLHLGKDVNLENLSRLTTVSNDIDSTSHHHWGRMITVKAQAFR